MRVRSTTPPWRLPRRNGVRMIPSPSVRKISSKPPVNLLSRSWIRKRSVVRRSRSDQERLRAGGASTANVQSGRGVGAVSDPPSDNTYIVTVNRSLTNSVVQALAGIGDPPGAASANLLATPEVKPAGRVANQAAVDFQRAATGSPLRHVIPDHCILLATEPQPRPALARSGARASARQGPPHSPRAASKRETFCAIATTSPTRSRSTPAPEVRSSGCPSGAEPARASRHRRTSGPARCRSVGMSRTSRLVLDPRPHSCP